QDGLDRAGLRVRMGGDGTVNNRGPANVARDTFGRSRCHVHPVGMINGIIVLVGVGIAGVVMGALSRRRKAAMARARTIGCADLPNVAGKNKPVTLEVTGTPGAGKGIDRKSTRLNSSHVTMPYAAVC